MRLILATLCIILMIGCTSREGHHSGDNLSDTTVIAKDTLDLKGLWAMPDYVDSTLAHKKISKYRMQWPTWFAILIDIGNDTLRTYGSIQDIETPYKLNGDTIHTFKETVTGEWKLIINRDRKILELINTDSKRDVNDPKAYTLNKRPNLEFLLDTLDNVHKTKTSITNYFNQRLFTGEYNLIGTQEKVSFTADGQISGLRDFKVYKIDVYYGTLHPYENLDNVTLFRDLPENSEEIDWELFKWEFRDDTLILIQFDWEIFSHQGRQVRDEFWSLSDTEIKLKRTGHNNGY